MPRNETPTGEARRLAGPTATERNRALAYLPIRHTGEHRGRILELPLPLDGGRAVVVPLSLADTDERTYARRWRCLIVAGRGIFARGTIVSVTESELRRSTELTV